MQTDFLIIGQGLAGSLVAWELISRGYQVVIVDNGKENASQVAAGLINPITGMRLVKTADIDQLLPAAKKCYAQLADFFRQSFFIEKPMLRFFRSHQELQNGLKRLHDPAYQNYLNSVCLTEKNTLANAAPYGYLEQKQTGYLLTRPLLKCLKDFFVNKGSYRVADFNYQAIQLKPVLSWRDIFPKQIIFCEGYQAVNNPWFSWLPFQPVKGEILTLEHQMDLPDNMINVGNWMIPINHHQIRVGATFDRENLNIEPTASGRDELLNTLKQISDKLPGATVISHQANIRPCTLDKQPFIGRHPQHKQLNIFNGFGAKGSVQIPWHSQRFADALLNGAPVYSDIQRHLPHRF
ncbi:MAG: NAD(P)/FAD-dependent oxidoreductase [Methylococcaceae bacterium]